MDKISNDSKLNDIMKVLGLILYFLKNNFFNFKIEIDAFNQAKNRMKDARENTRKIMEQ